MLLNSSIELHMGAVALFYPLHCLLPFSEMKPCHVSHTVSSPDSSHRAQEAAQSSVGHAQQTLPSGEALGRLQRRQVCSCQPPFPTGKTLHSQQKEPPGVLPCLRGLPGLLLTAEFPQELQRLTSLLTTPFFLSDVDNICCRSGRCSLPSLCLHGQP